VRKSLMTNCASWRFSFIHTSEIMFTGDSGLEHSIPYDTLWFLSGHHHTDCSVHVMPLSLRMYA
jgi:hypothetical protein